MVIPEDIRIELGRPTVSAADEAQWNAWIGQALYLIGKRLTLAELAPEDVDYVVLQSVLAHIRNPDSATQVDVSVDDGSSSRRYSSGAGRVVISDDLWHLLDPDLANASSVGSTQMYGEPDVSAYDPWVNV